jgi:lipopolysaccharide transport system ATP-binding protein
MKMSQTAVSLKNISKKFRLFETPKDRLKEALHPFKKKYHKEFWALRDISFEIPKGETLGIIGRNGSGKSTLLQTIYGVLKPTSGSLTTNGRISALLELGSDFGPEFTGRENLLMKGMRTGFSKAEIKERLPEIEDFADIGEFIDYPLKTYSSGMFVRLAFAVAINIDPDVLIIDEALSVGDIKFQEKCFRKFAEFQKGGRTIIFVTHSTSLVEQLCDRVIVLESGNIECIGDPQKAVSQYEAILFPRKNVVVKDKELPSSKDLSGNGQTTGMQVSRVGLENSVQGDSIEGELLQQFFADEPKVDQCQSRRSYNINELRFGDGCGEIIDYLILSPDEEDPVTIQSGNEIVIYIKVFGKAGISRPSIGVGIFTHTGLMICSANARLLNKKLSKIESGKYYHYKMSFRALMSEGYYFIHFGLTEDVFGRIVRHDARRSIATIRVAATPHLEGLADLSMVLEEVSLPYDRKNG